MQSIKAAKKRVTNSLFIPFVFVASLWVIKILQLVLDLPLYKFGVLPRTLEGLKGILFYPLIHGNARAGSTYEVLGNFSHLFSNSIPLIVMGFLILHSYQKIAWRVFAIIYLLSGALVWVAARESYHIGASGLVYGFAFFLFFSGVFRKDVKSMALALLVAFLYGGIIWGMLPIMQGVSFEGHIAGAVAGVLSAYIYRNVNPPRRFPWESEPDEDPTAVKGNPFWVTVPDPVEETKEENDSSSTSIDIKISDSAAEPTKPTTPPKSSLDNINNWEVKYHFVPKKKKE